MNAENKNNDAGRLLRFLTIRPRSVKEIEDYGRRKKISPVLVEEFVKKMKKVEYLDDENFTRIWVRDRKKFMLLGRDRLKRELYKKGIARELIEKVLNEEYPIEAEKETAREFIQKKKSLRKEKILAALLRRGFTYKTVKELFPSLKSGFGTPSNFEGAD